MSVDLRGRSLLTGYDLSVAEWRALLELAQRLKAQRRERREPRHLAGRAICLVFEKTSTRTRCAFEVACMDQGAGVTVLDPQSSQLGHKESIADTARVLGRMYHAIQYRGASQARVEALARHAGVPVYNGLTDDWHPTQMLADVLTMAEHKPGPLEAIGYAFVGDTRSNMGRSLLVTGALLGMDVRLAGPRALWPDAAVQDLARDLAARSGARITLTEDARAAVRGVDFVHTDVWVSLGEPKSLWAERIALLRPYRVDRALLAASGNPEVRLMHCLPALHDQETRTGEEVAQAFGLADGVEVAHDVFESPASIVFDQAENRMHTIKALLVATLADDPVL